MLYVILKIHLMSNRKKLYVYDIRPIKFKLIGISKLIFIIYFLPLTIFFFHKISLINLTTIIEFLKMF